MSTISETSGPEASGPDPSGLKARAQALARDGLWDEASAAYLQALPLAPEDAELLTGFAEVVLRTGHRSAAITLLRQAGAAAPDAPEIPARLADLMIAAEDLAGAEAVLDGALARFPQAAAVHRAAAALHSLKGDPARARRHLRLGYGPAAVFPPTDPERPGETALLVLISGLHGDTPLEPLTGDGGFRVTALAPEFHTGDWPAHDRVFNAIADAELCDEGLAAAAATAPAGRAARIINPPARVRRTGRLENARRLGALPDVTTAAMVALTRGELRNLTAQDLSRLGLTPPLALRAPGLHFGRGFERVDRLDDLPAVLERVPGDDLLLLDWLDTRSADGFHRKYRLFAVGGDLFPAHLAVSPHWKTHYVTGAMAERPDFRAEEARFLEDWTGVLGPRAVAACEAIRDTMGLDLFGLDFALAADGGVVLFEANSAMRLPTPPTAPIFHYRQASARRLLQAARELLRGRPGR